VSSRASAAPVAARQTSLAAETSEVLRSPLRHLDVRDISARVRREVRNREVHLPPVSTYRWWARRTESVNGSIIDAISRDRPGRMVVSDPFAGGGVIPLAAVMRGHSVYAQDLNPWAAAGLAAMLALPDPDALRDGIAALTQRVTAPAQAAYGTILSDGTHGHVSHTFRVAVGNCTRCGVRQRLFPHALVSLLSRVERNRPEAFLACPNGHLFEGLREGVRRCPTCSAFTDPAMAYTPRRVVTCPCGYQDRLEARAAGGLDWEVVLVERAGGGRRELALPTAGELTAAAAAHARPTRSLGAIPPGQETGVLLRHGFSRWEDLYPRRQRAMVEHLLELTTGCSSDESVVAALRLAVVGSTEMAGLLSRWDRYYLKSYESMAGHRFNFTTLPVEPNAWGTPTSGRGTTLRRLVQLVKAAEWMQVRTGRRLVVQGPVSATAASVLPLVGEDVDGAALDRPDVLVVSGSSQRQLLPSGSVDLVLTDPPYHDDVQYGELSLPLQAWAGLGASESAAGDAVVNRVTGQLVAEGSYTALLTSIFRESARLLRSDGHLVFSYANRDPRAWVQLFDALQGAGLRASGCAVVHSENETDHAKRGVRACTLDLLLDLVPVTALPLVLHRPPSADGPEQEFLALVASYALQIGDLRPGWQSRFLEEAASMEFLLPQRRAATSAARGARAKHRAASQG
jgi:putative DNA methylase